MDKQSDSIQQVFHATKVLYKAPLFSFIPTIRQDACHQAWSVQFPAQQEKVFSYRDIEQCAVVVDEGEVQQAAHERSRGIMNFLLNPQRLNEANALAHDQVKSLALVVALKKTNQRLVIPFLSRMTHKKSYAFKQAYAAAKKLEKEFDAMIAVASGTPLAGAPLDTVEDSNE
ncbi:MAG: hypothetical protein SPD80_03440 [Atopobium sp.]|uniref:hypothetical protein n=1 Tax=Atopobium sp. TaxID=1872650 RepID=UPI002A803747|nr:hypothetical protein [Atopobium sp.]MDY4522633.1 hypothetical protein [Atopobium sp.]